MPLPFIAAVALIGGAVTGGGAAGGIGGLKMSRSQRTVAAKAQEFAVITEATGARRSACEDAFVTLGTSKLRTMQEVLVPFDAAFSQLKNVDLETHVRADAAPAMDVVGVRAAGRLTLSAIDSITIVATGGAAAAGAYVGTQAAVSAMAVASTGTAVSSLSGVAATNATLAWLGGGTLATGGGGVAAGTVVLSGIMVGPAVLVGGVFVLLKGRESAKRAAAFEADADAAIARERQQHLILDVAIAAAQRALGLLDALSPRLARDVGWLEGLVARQTDWLAFTQEEQARIRGTATLALALSALVHTPVVDDEGAVTRAIQDATSRGNVLIGNVVV